MTIILDDTNSTTYHATIIRAGYLLLLLDRLTSVLRNLFWTVFFETPRDTLTSSVRHTGEGRTAVDADTSLHAPGEHHHLFFLHT